MLIRISPKPLYPMFVVANRIVSLLTLALLTVAPAIAQKVSHDPRPLSGFDPGVLPSYSSVEALMQAESGGSLRDGATLVGRAQLHLQPLAAPQALTLSPTAGKQAPGVQLLEVARAENGTARWISGPMPVSTGSAVRAAKNAAETYQEEALRVLESVSSVTRLARPREELRPMQVRADELGYTHARFEQVFEGIPVWGRDLYVHFDADGEVYAVNGTYEPTPVRVETQPTLAAASAVDQVVTELKRERRWAPLPDVVARQFDIPQPTSKLVLYPDGDRGLRLAYEVSLHPNLIEWYTYLVDARDGSVLNRIQRHCSLNHAAPAPVIKVDGFGDGFTAAAKGTSGIAGTFHDAQAVDLNGRSQPFRVYQHDNGSYYSIWDLPNLDADKSQMPDNPAGGAMTISLENSDLSENASLFHVTSTDNSWTDASAVSAHVNMSIAYEYFKNAHGRNAIDGKDQSIISIVHATQDQQPMDNAFWNGRFMVYGDGAQLMKPLAGGLDVAGHEMSHGVIEHTAGLVYQFQPGALNESFADVFGAMIDRDDLLMGEDIMRSHVALRDLLNPDNPQVPGPQPAHMNQYADLTINQDNGGVHVNSGIPNRAAALIINTIGHEKTEAIYYRALANYLTRNSQFGDARKAIIQSATDLYGAGSAEVSTVQQAFDQVGITDGTASEGGTGGGSVPPQTGGRSFITFMTSDGQIGLMDLTDPQDVQYGLLQLPGSVARATPGDEDWSQLSAPSDGQTIWFVSQDRQLSYIDLATMEVWVLDQLTIEPESPFGDIWNAVISPDEQFAALVSAYVDDPNLYFTNGQDVFVVPLLPEGTQPNTYVETIQYADVVSWSPNASNPRVAFDALNRVQVGSMTAAFWGMYELDFASEKIFNLVPSQSSSVSIGNVTYSKLSGDLIAFNYFDENWVADVMLADFSSGQTMSLDIPSYTYDGVRIEDAQRPTFAPNDALLAFSSPRLGALLFYEPTSQQLSAFELGTPVRNPHWFLSGGTPSTDAEEGAELPTTVVLHGNYPNPFNPSTTIHFELPQATEVKLEVFDVMGRRVQTLSQGRFAAGEHRITFEADGLATGTYIARLQAGETVTVRKMVLMR